MKTLKLLFVSALIIGLGVSVNAQDKTETFKVSGNCGMCKSKIEKAAKEAGAVTASWNQETKELTVTYKSATTNTARIQKKIAEAGYDNTGFTATIEAYKKLHACCQYERAGQPDKKSCCTEQCEKKDGKCASMEKCKEKGCCKDEETCKANGCCGGDHAGQSHGKMDCCKDGKCTKEGHNGKDCCKKEE